MTATEITDMSVNVNGLSQESDNLEDQLLLPGSIRLLCYNTVFDQLHLKIEIVIYTGCWTT